MTFERTLASTRRLFVDLKPLLVPALIFLLALTPRLAYALGADTGKVYRPVYHARPVDYTVAPGIDDVTYYLLTARSIAQGEGYAEPFLDAPSARYPPGWPAVLSVFYLLFGTNAQPAVVFNALVGAASCVLTYFLGWRLFDRKAGLWGALILALFPVHILYSPILLTEVFFTFLLTLTLIFAARGMTHRRALTLGLLAGALTLVRGEAVLLPAVFLVVLVLRGMTWRASARQIMLVGVGMAVLIAPWAVRNSLQLGSPVLLTTQTGVNFFVGHGRNAGGDGNMAPYFRLAEDYRGLPEPDRQVKIDRASYNGAWEGFRSDPLGDLALAPAKLRWFLRDDPTSGPSRPLVAAFWHGPLPFRAAQLVAGVYYYVVLSGTVLLVILRQSAGRPGAFGLLFAVIGLWAFIFGLLFFGDDRYHIPLLPIFSITAAAGFSATWSRLASVRLPPKAGRQPP